MQVILLLVLYCLMLFIDIATAFAFDRGISSLTIIPNQ
jgi:hypothetical protein